MAFSHADILRFNQRPLPEAYLSPERVAKQRARLEEAKGYWITRPSAYWPSWVYQLMGDTRPSPEVESKGVQPFLVKA